MPSRRLLHPFSASLLLIATLVFGCLTSNCIFAAQAPPSPPPKTEKELQVEGFIAQAREKLARLQWDAAMQDCAKALEVNPACTSAFLIRGQAYRGKGDFEAAMKEFDQLVAQSSRDSVAIADRAESFSQRSAMYYEKGEYLKAIDNAYFAILEKYDHTEAHCNRALAYLARQQWDKAVQSADRAVASNDKSAEAISIRGMAYAAKKNLDQALADQNKAVNLDPNLPAAYQRRAGVFAAKGDLVAASKDIEQALRLKPDFVDALCDRAYLYVLAKDNSKALADLDSAIRINPKFAKAHYLKGNALASTEKYDRAIACFDEAIKLQDKNAPFYCSRGAAKFAAEKYEEALEDLGKAIELDPKLTMAYQVRAKTYGKMKRSEEAQADAAMVKKLSPEPVKKVAKKKEEPKKVEEPPKFTFNNKPVKPQTMERVQASAEKIDRLVAANYKLHNISPNPKTSDEQFVRRVYLDITGTIPTFPQTMKFLNASEPDKRARLIDQLLSSDGYVSHSFNYWADILRYTDNLNGNVRGEPYRQWIKQSLAENKPWNKMVYELLTAEGLIWQNPATGYLQRDANMPLDNMNNTIRIFLGTRIGCAQCHNHPFDRWTQKDFYQIAAFTIGTQTQTGGGDTRFWKANPNERLKKEFNAIEQEEEDRRNNTYRFDRMLTFNQMIVNDQVDRKITLPKDYAYADAKPNDVVEPKVLFGKPVELKKGETPRQGFARWVVQKENPRFALTIANRLWKRAFGIGQIEPVDDMMDSTVAENPELMKFLESEMKAVNFDMKEFLRILYNTETYQRQACFEELQTGQPYHFQGPLLRRMTAEQVWDSFITLALPAPYEYRELPATVRTSAIGVDLNTVSAEEVLKNETKAAVVDGSQGSRQQKYTYKGVLLARASELPSPVPANHFLRVFGQSDRELISASSTSGSVPQVLFMFNGPITHMLLEKNSTIYNNIARKDDVRAGVKALFMTILSRPPDDEELELAQQEVKRLGAAGYGNVVWSLVNTREFLFVQ